MMSGDTDGLEGGGAMRIATMVMITRARGGEEGITAAPIDICGATLTAIEEANTAIIDMTVLIKEVIEVITVLVVGLVVGTEENRARNPRLSVRPGWQVGLPHCLHGDQC